MCVGGVGVCVCLFVERERENSGKYGLIKSDNFHCFFIKSYVEDTSQVTLNEHHNTCIYRELMEVIVKT